MTVQGSLCRTWSETQIVGFLMRKLKCFFFSCTKTKSTDQLHSDHTSDQCICFFSKTQINMTYNLLDESMLHTLCFCPKHNHYCTYDIQADIIITLSLGSIETDCVISEPYYTEVVYYRDIAK